MFGALGTGRTHERAEKVDYAKQEIEVDLEQNEREIAVMLAEVTL